MPETETSHFWVGHLPPHIREGYFEQSLDQGDDAPLSMFARDQDQKYYDADLLELGYGATGTVKDLVAEHAYSYKDQWAEELDRRASAAGLTAVDFFMFISKEEVKNPRSVRGDGYWLSYLGTIEYRI